MTTNSCAVPTCNTGRKSVKEKRSVFKVPSNLELREKWIAAIPGIFDLKPSQFVCEKHFQEQYIRRKWIKYDSNGRVIAEVLYARARLDPLAVPSEFENLSDVHNTTTVADSSNGKYLDVEHNYCSAREFSTVGAKGTLSVTAIYTPTGTPQDAGTKEIFTVNTPIFEPTELLAVKPVPDRCSSETRGCFFNIAEVAFSCTTEGTTESISIPKPWTVGELDTDGGSVVFSYAISKIDNGGNVPVTERNVKLTPNKQLRYFVHGRVVEVHGCNLPEVLGDIGILPEILEMFKNLNLCNGVGNVDHHHLPSNGVFKDGVDQWRDKNCTLISKWKRCAHCIKMRDAALKRESRSKKQQSIMRISRALNPIDQRKLMALRKKNERARRSNQRTRRRISILQQSLRNKAAEIASIREETLADRCSKLNIPALQRTALKEIITAVGKKNDQGRRYQEEWIMLCILMNIMSKSTYEFLRKNNVLPLPCSRTIRHYFSMIGMKCGFDEDFAKLLEKRFEKKTPLQRHGLILMDEINLRKSVAVCAKNLTYTGLTDFGNDGPQSTNIDDQATHGLVLMFQPLADSYSQPIAVFASKNSVKGEELAKLLIKAIGYLEQAGARIDGVIADGAATNAKMWSLLGVSGSMEDTKTWFVHPADEERKVYVFSDVPHLMKNIRNRLYNKKKLRVRFQQFILFYSNHPTLDNQI